MSTRNRSGSHYENHERAAELQDVGAHAHRVAEQQGKQDHLTAREHSRLAFEHSQNTNTHSEGDTVGHGIVPFGHGEIATLAYEYWEARGRPSGSSEDDWFRAVKELRARNFPGRS